MKRFIFQSTNKPFFSFISVNVVAPNGFWEPLQPAPQQAAPVQQSKAKETPNTKKKKKQNNNVEKNDRNEFDDWCGKALARLSSQVDVPTFLGFLKDVESPFEVRRISVILDKANTNVTFIVSYSYITLATLS